MINFRFHIVSLIAVFLALGVGVIMGTAVIDSAVVDRLESQQRGLEADFSEVRDENQTLTEELDALRDQVERFEEEGAPRLLVDELLGRATVIVASRGVDDSAVQGVADQLVTAGSSLAGVAWLTDRWRLDDDAEVEDLAEAVNLDPATRAAVLRDSAMTELADVLATGDGALEALVGAGFVELEPVEGRTDEDFARLPAGAAVVSVGGSGAEAEPSFGPLDLLRALVGTRFRGLPAVSVLAVEASGPTEVPDDAPPTLVAAVRADETLSQLVGTVDNVETLWGRLATVLLLDDLQSGTVGHFGVGEGAQGLLPPEEED